MKVRVSFKCPDAVSDAVDDAMRGAATGLEGLTTYERTAVLEVRRATVAGIVERWFRYGEYADIEIDTEADTATVVRP